MKLPKPEYTVTDVNHKYTITLSNGKTVGPLKSVTSILNIRAKPALIGWAAREAAGYFRAELLRLGNNALDFDTLEQIYRDAAQAHRRKAKDASDLGSACHDAFEAIIKGLELPAYPKELNEPIAAFKRYRLQSDIEVVATELAVASTKYRAGGRLDFLGYSKSRGGWGIGDYKTSSGWYGNDFAYQAGGGYALMVEEMYGVKIAWAEIVRFSKKSPYESEAKPVTDIAAAMAGFLEALAMVRRDETSLFGNPTFMSAGKPETPETPKAATKKDKAALPMGF